MSKAGIGTMVGLIGVGGVVAALLAVAQSQQPAQVPSESTPTATPARPGADRAQMFPVKLQPHDSESDFIRMPLPKGMDQYGRIHGDHLKQFDSEIVDISLESRNDGDLLWGRIAGTKYDEMAEALVEDKFNEWGLDASIVSISICRPSGSRRPGTSP